MIHSSIQDNLYRVKLMHSAAKEIFSQTSGQEFRKRNIANGAIFPFDARCFEVMKRESCIVGMVKAWAVVTIESLINHSLAESIDDVNVACYTIEHPRKKFDTKKSPTIPKSELGVKLAIYSNYCEEAILLGGVADELAGIRNSIIHDKPFKLYDFGSGDVEISVIGKRGLNTNCKHSYESLREFYEKCDQIVVFVFSRLPTNDLVIDEFLLVNLID